MGLSFSTFRLRFALLAAVVLSALSAAEATLAAAPTFGSAADREWPAHLTPVKDRDSVNHRAARASDASSLDDRTPQHRCGGDSAASLVESIELNLAARTALTRTAQRRLIAPSQLIHALLDLPPPVL